MSKYYSLNSIKKKNATYNLIIGERSNGKTYALLTQCIKDYMKDGSQIGLIRRWKEDIVGKRGGRIFAGLVEDGSIEKLTGGKFKGVHYFTGKFYLCNYDEQGKVIYSDSDLLGFAFALTDSEHDKSTSYPNVRNIVFDEFLTNKLYLPDEFVIFMNVVSTIVRRRLDVKIYMLGNTVNKYCPYFAEMGLDNIAKQRQGTIDLYHYGESELTVAVEYCSSTSHMSKEANKYFAFNNPKLSMITGGAWEIAIYPHLPYKYRPKDVLLTYFIEFNAEVYQANIIQIEDIIFTYIHAKTTEIKNPDDHIIYSLDYNPKLNYNRNLLRPLNKSQEKIAWFFKADKVFYQDNNIGDAIANYLKTCRSL
nr:Phage DNA packaging ATPase podovirus [Acinetobacter phage Phanie]